MIGIVILNYNGWNMTVKCIESIRNCCKKTYKIYIVDNCSTQGMTKEFEKIIEQSKDCEFIKNTVNKGYSAGNNIGIKKAIDQGASYILVTNNDVIFKENSIENLCDFLEKNSDYGIAGPKVYLPNGKIQEINLKCKMTISGKYLYLLRKTPLKIFSKRFIEKFHDDGNKDLNKSFDVYAVSGCCFMMSEYAAKKMYPLDENTFLFEEENIIGARMEKCGLKTVYNTDSEIIHIGGASTQEMSEFAYGCFVCSEQYYCREYLHASYTKRLPLYILRGIKYVKTYGLVNYIKFAKKVKI